MRFDIYGRYQLEVARDGGRWLIHRVGDGKRRAVRDVVIPADLRADDLATYLDDMLHELAGPGESVRRID